MYVHISIYATKSLRPESTYTARKRENEGGAEYIAVCIQVCPPQGELLDHFFLHFF